MFADERAATSDTAFARGYHRGSGTAAAPRASRIGIRHMVSPIGMFANLGSRCVTLVARAAKGPWVVEGETVIGSVVVFIVWFALVFTLGAYAIARASRHGTTTRQTALAGRISAVVDVATDRWGSVATACVVYLAGVGLALLVCWPIGALAHALENAVDWPTWLWFQARQLHDWSTIWHVLTNIGKPRLTQGIDLAAAIFFAVVWHVRKLRWWVPLVTLFAAYALEKYCQIILQDVVHRGHPATTLGTFPSGGCARVLIVYGLVIFLTITWLSPDSKRAWAIGGTALAVLISVQAYARIYNLEHWVTDVVGGIVFGLIGLIVMASVFRVLSRAPALPAKDLSSTDE